MALAHQGAQIHADLLHRWTTDVPPAVVNLIDGTIAIENKSVGNIDFAMCGVGGVNHLQLVEQFAVGIHQKWPIGAQGIARLIGAHLVINRDGDDFAIIDAELRLQVSHVVRQLTTIFGSEIPAIENENAREAT